MSGVSRTKLRKWVVAAVVLATAGLRFLSAAPPAFADSDGDSFFTHIHTEKAMANVTIAPGRAGPIAITIQLETVDERPLAATAVSVTLSNPEIGIEPAVAEARRGGDDQWRVTMAAPVAGRWTLGLGIRISANDKVSVEAPILVK